MTTRIRTPLRGLVGLAIGLLVAGQTPPTAQQPPVFRAGVNFVSVDVYPRRDGKILEGLRAGDFQVTEDGKPQKVETFEFIRFESSPVDAERRDPSSQADSDRQARDPRNRLFVVYLDLAHTTIPGSHAARQPIVDFLTGTIGQRDLFGFMTAELPVSQLVFGRRTEAIESQLAQQWTWGQAERVTPAPPRTPAEQRLVECALVYEARTGRDVEALLLELSREDLLLTSLENLMARLRDLRDERKNILFISEGWVPQGAREDLMNVSVSEGAVPQVGVGPGGRIGVGQSMQPFNTNTTDCDTRIRRLASIDFERRFRELLTTARQANVSFYPVDVGGLRVVSSIAGPRSTLMTLAENTDGFAITNTNDLTGGVRRIAEDLSAFYLLGYYSTNTATDGRYRRINVQVTGPRVEVTARRGYLAPTMTMAAGAVPAATGPTPVDAALARLSALRDDTEMSAHGVQVGGALEITVDIAASAVTRPAWQNGGQMRIEARSSSGRVLTAAGSIATGERSARIGVPVPTDVGGPWQVSVFLSGADRPVEARLEIAAPAAAALVGEALAWRGAASPRVPLKPLGDFRLTRAERLRVEWPLLLPAETRSARLLDRKGQPLGGMLPFVALPPERQAVAIDLPLSAFSEGDYVLELSVTRGAVSERRLLAFRVIR